MRGRSVFRLLVFAVLAILAIVGIWTLSSVKHQAKAEIRISPIVPYLVFKTEDTGGIPFYESFVNTQASVIRCPKVIQRVLERQDVQATQWYKNERPSLMERLRGDRIPRAERLRNCLVARPRPRTEIIDVTLVDHIAEDARVIVQAVVEEYERYAGTHSDEARDELNRRLTLEYTRLRKEVTDWENICFGIQEELGTGDPDRLLSNKAIALDEEKAALAAIRQQILAIQMQIEKAGAAEPNRAAVVAGATDPNNLTPAQKLEYSQNQLEILREQAKVMNDELNKKQEEYNRLFAKSQELKRETTTLQHKRGLFAAVQARKDAKDMEREVRGRISVLAPAVASFTPHNDRRMLYTGIVLAVFLILVGGMMRTGRRPADDVSRNR